MLKTDMQIIAAAHQALYQTKMPRKELRFGIFYPS
jgi:hypothetical protein